MDDKLRYTAPTLTALGSVADLTKVGDTNPGSDVRSGSVLPPGHG